MAIIDPLGDGSDYESELRSMRQRPCRPLATFVAATVVASGLVVTTGAGASPAAPAGTTALPASPVDYAYDSAGQLRGVSQASSGGAARYNYDDSGNLLSIDRYASSTVSVISVVPNRAAGGDIVTISGTGFSTTPTDNVVRFNGAPATVSAVAATATRLTVAVPRTATSGPVSVITPNGTATSQQPFTVDPFNRGLVRVSGFSPGIGAAGTTVTITGTGFEPVAAANTVVFGATRARVGAASATSLTVTVPEAAGSGRIRVANDAGSGLSITDFVVVPRPYVAADVATTGTVVADGDAVVASIPASGKVALLRFTGVRGQRLSLGLTASTIPTNFAAALYTPYGATFAREQFDRPWLSTNLRGGLALPALPHSGTYQIVIDPVDAGTGSVTATLSTRITGELGVSGPGTTVTLGRAGQQAELTVAATAGQRLSFGFTGSTFGAATATAKLLEPNGVPMLWANAQDRGTVGIGAGDNLDFTATETGQHTLLFGSTDASTGAVTVTASTDIDVGAFTLGVEKTIAIGRPGQNARATFAGTGGQRLSLDFTAYSFGFLPFVAVEAPDGTVLISATVSGFHLDVPMLPATGTYAITFSPFSSTGSLTARLTERFGGGVITATGPSVTVSITAAARTAELTYATTAGQALAFAFTGWTFPAGVPVRAQVQEPNGVTVVRDLVGPLDTIRFVPTSTGMYWLTLTPDDGASTGSVVVTLSAEVNGGALTIGAAKPVAASRLGQTTSLTMVGAAGQRLSLSFGSYTFGFAIGVRVVRPDGTVFRDGNLAQTQLDLDPLPVAGTYQVVLQPSAETGSAQLTLVERIDQGVTAIGGAITVLNTSLAGRYAETSFTATAGQRLSFGFTSWGYPTGISLRARLLDSAGTALMDVGLNNGHSFDATTPTAGTYRLVIGPTNFGTGSVRLTLCEQFAIGPITLGSTTFFGTARAGQATWMTYAGTAGQNLGLGFFDVSFPVFPKVVVRRPDGTILTEHGGAAGVPIATLPVTGIYEILLSPYSSTGSASVMLVTLPPPALDEPLSPLRRQLPRAVPYRDLEPPPGWNDRGTRPELPDWLPAAPHAQFQVPSPFTAPAPPQAPPGTTALAGRVVAADGPGHPLEAVTVRVGSIRTKTDHNGQFLVAGLAAGHQVLRVDGATASTPERSFGLYDIGVDIHAGRTTVLAYPIWLTPLDTEHTVSFPSPTVGETVITTPSIPGLELRLPAGAVVRDTAGKVVTSLGITAIRVDRPPFPLPSSHVPAYFTVQPGSAHIYPEGARLVYPNFTNSAPGREDGLLAL
jgi:YD repeat-containing protein